MLCHFVVFPFSATKEREIMSEDDNLIDLEAYRSEIKPGSDSHPVAYFESVWGESEYGWSAMIVDIEDLRKGNRGLGLRPPETSFEIELLVRHIRAVANDIARDHRMNHLVKPEDDM